MAQTILDEKALYPNWMIPQKIGPAPEYDPLAAWAGKYGLRALVESLLGVPSTVPPMPLRQPVRVPEQLQFKPSKSLLDAARAVQAETDIARWAALVHAEMKMRLLTQMMMRAKQPDPAMEKQLQQTAQELARMGAYRSPEEAIRYHRQRAETAQAGLNPNYFLMSEDELKKYGEEYTRSLHKTQEQLKKKDEKKR